MKRKEERVFGTPQQEIQFLRRQIAGFKGQMGLLKTQVEDLNKCLSMSRDELAGKESTIRGFESQVGSLNEVVNERNMTIQDLRNRITEYTERIEDYNSLPWWSRIFRKV